MNRETGLAIAIVTVMALGGLGHTQPVDPRDLFTENPAEAAVIFESRFRTGGSANDGISAVVASRAAGRYAHARALLVEVTPKVKPGGVLETQARELEAKLAHLTVMVGFAGDPIAPGAIVKVDGQLPERLGDQLVIDLGDHTVTIEQPMCARFAWQGRAVPDDVLRIPVHLDCQRQGTLHLSLISQWKGDWHGMHSVLVDRKVVPLSKVDTDIAELDVALDPGVHTLKLENHGRVITDEAVTIQSNHTVARRFSFPWRAQTLKFGVRAASVVAASRTRSLAGFGAGVGVDGSFVVVILDVGAGESAGRGGLWAGFELGVHVLHRPLWQLRHDRVVIALDFDPLVIRTELQNQSVGSDIRSTRFLSFAPIRLTSEWSPLQLQLTLWPLAYMDSRINTTEPMAETGLGFAATMSLAWHN